MTLGARLEVTPEARGERLDAFLARALAETSQPLSRSRIKALIDEGMVRVDEASQKPSYLLRGGETIEVTRAPPEPVALVAEEIPLAILYEDAELIALDKPAGLVVHPGAGHSRGTLVNALLAHCHDLGGIGGELRPGIVHRLDKETSGCIVVAKTERALNALQEQFRERTVEKVYRALVHGVVEESGRFDTLHGRHPTDRLRFSGTVARGRRAITEWRRLEVFDGASFVEVRILTGRTHQIRMHFSEASHPLLHDFLYGAERRERRLAADHPVRRAAERLGRHALHAWRCRLAHPVTGDVLLLEAPNPPDFEAALRVLRGE